MERLPIAMPFLLEIAVVCAVAAPPAAPLRLSGMGIPAIDANVYLLQPLSVSLFAYRIAAISYFSLLEVDSLQQTQHTDESGEQLKAGNNGSRSTPFLISCRCLPCLSYCSDTLSYTCIRCATEPAISWWAMSAEDSTGRSLDLAKWSARHFSRSCTSPQHIIALSVTSSCSSSSLTCNGVTHMGHGCEREAGRRAARRQEAQCVCVCLHTTNQTRATDSHFPPPPRHT
jgi:hypothetical protein